MTDAEIEALYLRHRRPFIAWAAKQFGLAQEDALDVYQEAIIAFVRNVRAGRYDPAASEPSTYLFAIGRNQALNALRRRKGRDARNVSDLRIAHSPESEQRHDEEHNAHLIAGGMAALSEKESPTATSLFSRKTWRVRSMRPSPNCSFTGPRTPRPRPSSRDCIRREPSAVTLRRWTRARIS